MTADRARRGMSYLCLGLASVAAALAGPAGVSIGPGELEVDAGQTWATRVVVPRLAPGSVPVLALRARVRTPSLGGCNYVLQVLLNGLELTESPMRPRLVNKPPWFDPPGTEYHFSWYGAEQRGWMTIFSPDFGGDWGGTGRDYDFLFDLSDLVADGETATLAFRYLNPDIPRALGVDRAPLVIDQIAINSVPAEGVERSRHEALKGQRVTPGRVDPHLHPGGRRGERPYEIEWSGRQESPRAQVAFDDLRGWTLHVLGDASVSLSASVEHVLWRPRLARFSYAGGSIDTTVEIRPPRPIPIHGRFDAANLWLYGAWDRVGDTPLRIAAVLEDQAGREYEMDLGTVTASYWGMQHGVLRPSVAQAARFPMRFTALRIANCRVKGQRHAYLESLAFYQQERRPPRAPRRPEPAVFPVSDDGMLPTPPPETVAHVRPIGLGAEFSTDVRGSRLEFRVRPEGGCLNGVTARWDRGPRWHPMADGGPMFDRQGAPPGAVEVVSSSLRDGCLMVRWRESVGRRALEWEADYSLRGCTLVVDVRCSGGKATGLAIGEVAGLCDPRGIEVPYLLMGQKPGPWIAHAGGIFVSVLPDWYHSDCSAIDTSVVPTRGDRIGLMRGTSYQPLTDGRRNPLHDRILVTVSSEFIDTLPNARNPVSPNRERLAPYMFYMADQLNPNLYCILKRYGIDQVIATDFAALFVANHYAEGFAARWRPHPSLTVDQVREYRSGIQSLGYLFGTYMDATDFYPGSEFWDENRAVLGSDGDLTDGWWGNYLVKPALMPGLIRAVGEKAKGLYASDCVYLDVHTNRGPQALDFEAGAPGAGVAREQVVANGDCIVEAREQYGSTISEGLYRWMYAGLTDMDYATLITSGATSELAPLVDFDLLKIHPFQHGTMMGHHPACLLSSEEQAPLYADTGRGSGPDGFYKYISASLAYGHMLLLGYWYTPPLSRFVHYYALMQGVQSEYLRDTAAEIGYHDGTRLLPTSRALAEGSQRLGRVHVRYSRGLRVWVNCNADKPWVVEASGRTFELPPHGWLIEKPNEVLAYSAIVGGQRVDFVRCPGYLYFNTGDARASEGPLDVDGAVWLKREGLGWRLIPCGDLGPWERFPPPGLPSNFSDFRLASAPPDRGCRTIVVDTRTLLGKPAGEVRLTARGEDGEVLEADVHQLDDGRLQFAPTAGVADYVME